MKKAIIYGLGKEYYAQRSIIKMYFEVIGYCDKKITEIGEIKVIPPNKLAELSYDYIYITTSKYELEIRKELLEIGIEADKIITKADLFGNINDSQIREKWVGEQLSHIPNGKTILDAGAGECRYAKYCRHLHYISQDFCEYEPKNDRQIKRLLEDEWDTSHIDIISDITNIPLENESVDAILCTEVLEHLSNPVEAIKEFSRLLREEGVLILTAPFASPVHMAPYHFADGFSRYWYEEHLTGYDFEIEEITANGDFFSYLALRLSRVDEIAQIYGTRKLEDDEYKNIVNVLEILKNLSTTSRGSEELMCFGYFVVARKKKSQIKE